MSTEPPTFAAVFTEIAGPEPARPATIRAAFEAILAGAWTPAQIAGLVVALRMRGETADVITAAAFAMRSAMIAVDHGLEATLDTCGTGGDGLGTLNVSTAAAIVVAALGIPVAKHGNRAVSSRSGSADVVEALGIPIDLPADRQAAVLCDAGIAFLFAPTHHPAMKHAASVRRELGVRTIFNVLGPLANPARATHQLVGTYDDALRPVMAESLRALGVRRAWIVRGEDGTDEVSPSGSTRVTELDGDRIRERIITPEDFGVPRVSIHTIAGADCAANAKAIEAILRGEPHPARNAVVLNAAAAAVVAKGGDPKDATARVGEVLASGHAFATLERWRTVAARARAT
jgi:anthranilate phosphoribosyltransferase